MAEKANEKNTKSDPVKEKPTEKPVREKKPKGARIKKFFKDYKSEIKKIVWPTKDQVIKNTSIVVGVILVVGILVGILDSVFGLGIQALGGLF